MAALAGLGRLGSRCPPHAPDRGRSHRVFVRLPQFVRPKGILRSYGRIAHRFGVDDVA